MSDEQERELRVEARKSASAAAAKMADIYETTAGGVITGYCLVAEITTAEGRYCIWLTGEGADPDEEHLAGLDAWRLEGIVRKVLRDLDAHNVRSD